MPTERREGAIRVGATGQRATGGARRFQRKAAVFGGWHEPDESRGSCPDLGAARGETPRADSANPHVAFDVAGAGDVAWSRGISAKAGAPVLDPTDVAGAGDVAWSRGISAKAGAPVLDPTDGEGAGNVAWPKCVGHTGAPVLDPTDVAGAGDVAWSRGISAKAGAPVLDPTERRTEASARAIERASSDPTAMKRSNVRGAKGPCHLQSLRRKEGKDEMIKASIDLQDLRRRIYVKAKAEPSWRFERRRHLAHAQKRKGFGWERRSRLTRGCLRLSGETRQAESRPSRVRLRVARRPPELCRW